jgi:hypothetical protein
MKTELTPEPPNERNKPANLKTPHPIAALARFAAR